MIKVGRKPKQRKTMLSTFAVIWFSGLAFIALLAVVNTVVKQARYPAK